LENSVSKPEQQVSIGKKILSVLLLILGGFFTYSVFIQVSVGIVSNDLDFIFMLFAILAVVSLWLGITTWKKRWKLVLGIVLLFFSLIIFVNTFTMTSLSSRGGGSLDEGFYMGMSFAHIAGTFLFVIPGILLVFSSRSRKRKKS